MNTDAQFDDAVIKAMAKWPDVPECYGWLSLDRRGNWRIKDELIHHPRAVAFLSRHYFADGSGCWAVQNGPQRVFVELEYTPWIYRFDAVHGFATHTGRAAGAIDAFYADDDGNVLLAATTGIGIIDDRDLTALAERITQANDGTDLLAWNERQWPLATVARASVAARFGFVASPVAA